MARPRAGGKDGSTRRIRVIAGMADLGKSPPFSSRCLVDESAEWLVVDKPAGMLAHPSKPGCGVTLWDRLRELLAVELVCGGQVSIINRLDRETSGLTLVAKTRQAASWLSQEMSSRRIAKEYLAVAHGWPPMDRWTIDAPILRQGIVRPSPIHLKQAVHPDGVPASTRFEVISRFAVGSSGSFCVIRAHPLTGRMHQIRVHLAHSGHPIVGDKIYGEDEIAYLDFIRTGWTPELKARLLLPRHALHSAFLRIEALSSEWRSPLPPDIASFVRSAGQVWTMGVSEDAFRPV